MDRRKVVFERPFLGMTKESETTKVREAVALAKQVVELRRELKRREKEMSLEEFVSYVDRTREI